MILTGKNITILIAIILFIGVSVAAISFSAGGDSAKDGSMAKKTRVMLVGASVGQDWKLQELNERMPNSGYVFESVAVWKYDKTEALEEVLMRPKRKFHPTRTYLEGFFRPSPVPADIIILKECAAYFPGDINHYKELISSWVGKIKASGKGVMVATIVPVTQQHSNRSPGRLEAILEYNDWIRDYAKKENIALLDLEASVRRGDSERTLRDDLTSGDGLHLNKDAYKILDRLLVSTCGTSLQ